MTVWIAIVLAGLGCWLLKVAGLSVPPRILERPLVERVADLIPVALLSALIAVQVFTTGSELTLDARAVGLGWRSSCSCCGRRSWWWSSARPRWRHCSDSWHDAARTA